MSDPIGVLVMAYGGPGSLDEVEPYLLDVRGFRATPAHVVEEVRARYAAIGGRSPILERTEAQARALEGALNTNGQRYRVAVGMRHWRPYIAQGLAQLEQEGVRRAVGLVMAPHYSRMSVELYFKKAAEAETAVSLAPVHDWHLLPGYLDALFDRVQAALRRFPEGVRDTVPVIFTAHSLPQRILEWDDPYPKQLLATARALADRLPGHACRFAYQSAAMTRDPWLGPDAGDVIEALAQAGHRELVIAPIGFTCEHVEVLYDVDIEFQRRAAALGVRLERSDMVNADPRMIAGLARLVEQAAAAQGWL
jgi:ferrochelatase